MATSSLRTYVRRNLQRLRSSPVLLVTSSPPGGSRSGDGGGSDSSLAGTKRPSSLPSDEAERKAVLKARKEARDLRRSQTDDRVGTFVERHRQCLAFEFGLRTVPAEISSAYPTAEGVDEAIALAKRAGLKKGGGRSGGEGGGGEGVVIGVGSGAAIDLAKAVSDELFGSEDRDPGENWKDDGARLVLAPCTWGGLWAASSDAPSLLLDPAEGMLVPHRSPRRRAAAVTTGDLGQWALPPLRADFRPSRRSEGSNQPTMAHVAAAGLAVLLDAARTADRWGTRSPRSAEEATELAAACARSLASVLELAAQEGREEGFGGGGDGDDDDDAADRESLARDLLLGSVPRLSDLTAGAADGTAPQRSACALLPTHFPQCHFVTYLACTLPATCDALRSDSSPGEGAMVDAVAKAMTGVDGGRGTDVAALSSWASRMAEEAGIPSLASAAYGTPDWTALTSSLDSYEALTSSTSDGGGGWEEDDRWFVEDVLRRSLSR
ncbi:hypothetical protein ACHAWF_001540 [Thalassiosira exigua]